MRGWETLSLAERAAQWGLPGQPPPALGRHRRAPPVHQFRPCGTRQDEGAACLAAQRKALLTAQVQGVQTAGSAAGGLRPVWPCCSWRPVRHWPPDCHCCRQHTGPRLRVGEAGLLVWRLGPAALRAHAAAPWLRPAVSLPAGQLCLLCHARICRRRRVRPLLGIVAGDGHVGVRVLHLSSPTQLSSASLPAPHAEPASQVQLGAAQHARSRRWDLGRQPLQAAPGSCDTAHNGWTLRVRAPWSGPQSGRRAWC